MEKNINITSMENEFIDCMINNDFSNLLETKTEWLFAITDELSYSKKQSNGVVSSLVKKGLIWTEFAESDNEYILGFTTKGKEFAINVLKYEIEE